MARPLVRQLCETCLWIDVRPWRKDGRLEPGRSFVISWVQSGQPCGAMEVQTASSGVKLRFEVYSFQDERSQRIEQDVPVTWTPCQFGGGRPWFRCTATADGRYCGRRVAILYLGAPSVFA